MRNAKWRLRGRRENKRAVERLKEVNKAEEGLSIFL